MHEKSAKKAFFGYQIVEKKHSTYELNINEIRSQSHHNAEIFLNLSRTDMNQMQITFF